MWTAKPEKKTVNGEYTAKPLRAAKVGSETVISWNSNKTNTKMDDDVMTESKLGKE
jgi:hypothetical protein